jgi:hypothetical protein
MSPKTGTSHNDVPCHMLPSETSCGPLGFAVTLKVSLAFECFGLQFLQRWLCSAHAQLHQQGASWHVFLFLAGGDAKLPTYSQMPAIFSQKDVISLS